MSIRKYPIEMNWKLYFRDMNISAHDVLRYASLPLDLLSRKSPMVTANEYFKLWNGIEALLSDNPTFPLDIATSIIPETFSPPLFAAFCSQNLNIAAERPFLTANDAMWSFFGPQNEGFEKSATYTETVRACLMEYLASGQYSVDDVASRLAVSRRTLQRHLSNEGTTFQEILDGLREKLARHYLYNSDYSNTQIAFLLGYEDPNSFSRAFRLWTGETPEGVRTSV